MFIKYLYSEFSSNEWTELDVPNYDSREEIIDYLCELPDIPTWSDRFDRCRIHYEVIDTPSREFLEEEIGKLRSTIAFAEVKVDEYTDLLKKT